MYICISSSLCTYVYLYSIIIIHLLQKFSRITHIYIYIHVHISCAYIRVFMHMCIHICISAYLYTCIHVYMSCIYIQLQSTQLWLKTADCREYHITCYIDIAYYMFHLHFMLYITHPFHNYTHISYSIFFHLQIRF